MENETSNENQDEGKELLPLSVVENVASSVVQCISRCVEIIRDEYSPTSANTKGDSPIKTTRSGSRSHRTNHGLPALYTRMVEDGIVREIEGIESHIARNKLAERVIVSDVNSLLSSKQLHSTNCSEELHHSTNKGTNQVDNDERYQLVSDILFPLWKMLIICYDILDQAPSPVPPILQALQGRDRRRRILAPAPPRGMLSIAHYTDIACLLEFTVCTSILPWMDPNILLSSKCYSNIPNMNNSSTLPSDTERYQEFVLEVTRGRRLPKSLAGRLPKNALAWGIIFRENIGKQQQKLSDTNCLSSSIELDQAFQHMGELLMLDRFRPMLLPRHIADLYAARLKAANTFSQLPSNQRNEFMQIRKLHIQLGLSINWESDGLTSTTRTSERSTTTTCIESAEMALPAGVESQMQAQAYQHLLRHGHIQTPKWLVQQVSRLLTQLASRDLSAVVDVFVPTHSSGLTQIDTSAASQRLGRALAQTYTLRAPQLSADRSDSLKIQAMLANQMAKLLETEAFPFVETSLRQESPSSTSTLPSTAKDHSMHRHTLRQLAILETIWATLMQLPASAPCRSSELDSNDHTNVWQNQIRPSFVHGILPSNTRKQVSSSPSDSLNIHLTIRRLGALFSCQSPSTKASPGKFAQICRWLLLAPLSPRDRDSQYLPSFPIGQLLRVASSDSTNCGGNVLFSASKHDAIQALRSMCHAFGSISQFAFTWRDASDTSSGAVSCETKCLKTDGCSLFAMSVIYALAPCQFDNFGYRYYRHVTSEEDSKHQESPILEKISVLQQSATISTSDVVADITKRAEIFVDSILLNGRGCHNHSTASALGLSCRLFQWCLRIFLSTLSTTTESNRQRTPSPDTQHNFQAMAYTDESFRLVSMVLLPLLCEKCDPTELLLVNDTHSINSQAPQEGSPISSNNNEVLGMVRLVLSCTAERFVALQEVVEHSNTHRTPLDDSVSLRGAEVDPTSNSLLDLDASMLNAAQIMRHIFDAAAPNGEPTTPGSSSLDIHDQQGGKIVEGSGGLVHDGSGEDDDLLLTISSLVLSLLITVLELGSSRRPENEEKMIQSFHPILKSLAEWTQAPSLTNAPASTGTSKSQSWLTACAGLADMSSYCMALIASRCSEPTPETIQKGENGDNHSNEIGSSRSLFGNGNKWEEALACSRDDLESPHPPIRARGMVSLGKLARGYLAEADTPHLKQSPKLIEEIDDRASLTRPRVKTGSNQSSGSLEILRLSTKALLDPESYVFLAAIQAIVAAGDLCPRELIPAIGRAIAAGTLATSDNEQIELVSEQRIKLAEALMFLIRRRAATDEYVSLLIDLMIFGSAARIGNKHDKTSGTDYDCRRKQHLLIQKTTDDYFDQTNNNGDDGLTMKEHREEQDVRLRTGGPVFETEESDIVRSARVSVIAELVCASNPSAMAPHAALLTRLCVDALRLEASRPVARSASLLAREMYGAVLREQNELIEVMEMLHDGQAVAGDLPMPFTMALISSQESPEEVLLESLRQQVSSFTTMAGGGNSSERVYDPATSARCQEAILLRKEAEDGGILAAARLLVAKQTLLQSSGPLSMLNIVEQPTNSSKLQIHSKD